MKKTVRILTFLLCVSLFVGLIPLHSGADGTTETTEAVEGKPYIEEGLIAWYDGANNSNGLQNPMADYWKDLTGNVNHIDLRRMVSIKAIEWADNAMMVNPETGLILMIPDNVKEQLKNTAHTIELVLGDITYDATESVTLLSSDNGELSLGFDVEEDGSLTLAYRHGAKNTQYPLVPNAEGYLSGYTLAITSDAASADGTAEGRVTLYADGVELASAQVGYSVDMDYLYVGRLTDPACWGGELHGLRIYERVLTPEELAANTEADRFNYRQGNRIDPVEQYGPTGPHPVPPLPPGGSSYLLIFEECSDLIPLLGFYGSVNLLDYLYPYESDEEKWEGARIMRTEKNETDYDGNELTNTSFYILYNSYCAIRNFTPLTGKEARYVAVSMVVNGEFDDMTLRVNAYDVNTQSNMDHVADWLCGSIDFDKPGEVQHLVLDTGGVFDDYEQLTRLYVEIEGMDPTDVIYLRQIMFFENETDAYEYAGYKPADSDADTETAPDTDNIGCETGANIETYGETDGDTQTIAVCPPERFGGCKSVVGFGAAVLAAVAAFMVLKPSKRE